MRGGTAIDEVERYGALFQALGEPIRMTILSLIANVDEMPCTRLVDELDLSKSTISYHIKILRHADLIDVRKDGRNFHYTVRQETLTRYTPELLRALTKATPTSGGRVSSPARV